ncbi:hypothetical protein HD593_007303 [Nonomuraea rubra]|uniref:Uncharacterized protein n=1 Tax=Nonomuraea rubra TaxID=46180 RepID=A0A7X0U2D0_9ACTN|nr:hypothetical protein [Nonomuraea rubra]
MFPHNGIKGEVALWWLERSNEAFACGLERLERRSRAGVGRLAAALKSRNDSRLDGHVHMLLLRLGGCVHVVLFRRGRIKVHECTRELARHVAAGTASGLKPEPEGCGRRAQAAALTTCRSSVSTSVLSW